jgi:hypothetical protein
LEVTAWKICGGIADHAAKRDVQRVLSRRHLRHQDVHLIKPRRNQGESRLMFQLARKAGHLPLASFDRSLSKIEGTQKL